MPKAQFTVHTSLAPSEVLQLLTDFGPDRAKHWPNINEAHFKVHDTGPNWAEVTEGTGMGWERERYEWDAAAGIVTIETLDSNLWGPGSGWRSALSPADDGTDVHVTLTRVASSFQGKLVGAAIPLVGGHLSHRWPMDRAVHRWGVGLEEHLDRAQVQAAPPSTPLTTVVPGSAGAAAAATP